MNFKRMWKNVNRKQVIGIVLAILGVILFILSIDAARQIAEAEALSRSFSNLSGGNSNLILKSLGGGVEHKIEYYKHWVVAIQVISAVFAAAGVIMLVMCKKKRK